MNTLTTKTFDYGGDGIIEPIYYSSDDCNNAYILFTWKISSLFVDVDDYRFLHYCVLGHDNVVYQGITQASNPYILLNLVALPMNSNNLFTVTIRAVIQTYKGYTSIIERRLSNLPKLYCKFCEFNIERGLS